MVDRKLALESIKKEMTSAWAYLHAYVELFEHADEKRQRLLAETAPGFFALVQKAFLESALSRLMRLMDPEKSCGHENFSFKKLCCPCSGVAGFEPAMEQFAEVRREWHRGKYKPLKEHRNKVSAHNDFPTIQGASPLVTTKLTLADARLIKELFRDLWGVLATAHHLLMQSSLIEPQYEGLNQLPTAIFPYLSYGKYVGKTLASRPDMFADFADFDFAEVGRDGITKLIS